MHSSPNSDKRGRLLLCLAVLIAVATLIILPPVFRSNAGPQARNKGVSTRTSSHDPGILNYDIRMDKSAADKMNRFRDRGRSNAAAVAGLKDKFVRGEQALEERNPKVKVQYNRELHIPEVIAPDVRTGRASLAAAAGRSRSETLRGFLEENSDLVGVSPTETVNLKPVADYKNPEGNLSFAELGQEVNGIPVFRGGVKAAFTKSGEMFRVVNSLAPGLEDAPPSTDFGDPQQAVRAAAASINRDPASMNLVRNDAESNDKKAVFGTGDWATTAEKMYFPTEPGVAVPAWRVLIWQQVNAYYLVVDAETGTLLFRKNMTNDQTQSASYNVYANPNAMINVAHNPFPFSPGPLTPDGTQGTGISRTLITLRGNEDPYTFNTNGWIADGINTTDGNNAQAGLDRESPNRQTVPSGSGDIDPTGSPTGSPTRVFDFPVNPTVPVSSGSSTGDSPLPAGQQPGTCLAQGTNAAMTDYQKASVTQLFYIVNRYHDEAYRLGFNEQAGNFQASNFGRGGSESDRVSAQAQDCSGTNNANFTTPPDGVRPLMQMYLWSGPNPDIDGSFDADVVVHEHTHGLSNRLHGNGSGLGNDMAGGMGEGWSDFYGLSMLSQESDPINGIYTTGGYDTYKLNGSFTNNNYYGIRRFPYAVMAFTGANGKPHNPLTFADIDATKMNFSDGAFAPRVGTTSISVDEVHNAGEIWAVTLWEVRAKFVARLGWAVGNRRWLQFVTDGMKLAPATPTFLSERDAIIAAAQNGGTAQDVVDIWAGFAIRGMGASASIQNGGGVSDGGTGTTRVTEAFDLPNLLQTPALTVSDATGNNNGYAEPGENITLTIPLMNNGGTSATGTTLQVVGGGSANYGTIDNNQTVTRTVSFTVPANASCGSVNITIAVNSSLGPTNYSRSIIVGIPNLTTSENFDGAAAPALPAGWAVTTVQNGTAFAVTANGPKSAPNAIYAVDPTSVGGGTDLTSPLIRVSSTTAAVTFQHRYLTENGWDGAVLEISINGGDYQDIITAGGAFLQNPYNGKLGVSNNSPFGGRSAWTGDSVSYIQTVAQLPASANGQYVRLRWRFGADDNTAGVGTDPGWKVDDISLSGAGFAVTFTCSTAARKPVGDFDGDGKTDIAIFRPSDGNWWVDRSTDGLFVQNWGASTDIAVPGDYDGDGKADVAIFRPSIGVWAIVRSIDQGSSFIFFGLSGDIPVPADYDGDGKTDIAIFRPTDGDWWILYSTGGYTKIHWGLAGDVPVPADYDGDGKTDLAIYRSGQWWIFASNGSNAVYVFGSATDKPVPSDYDGDGKAEPAVFTPASGSWTIYNPANNQFTSLNFGGPSSKPVTGDFDGDRKSDIAYFENGQWWILRSTLGGNVIFFGLAGDVPGPATYYH